jgi:hypothetical protein
MYASARRAWTDLNMSENSGRAIAIFTEALQQPMAERGAFLDQACAGNNELRGEVEALLRAHEHLGNFMETPPFDAGFLVMLDPEIDEEPPKPNSDNGDSNSK